MIRLTTLTLAALLAAGTAHAAVVSYTDPVFTFGDSSDFNYLTPFNDALGTLDGVHVDFNGTISGFAANGFTYFQPALVTISPYLNISLIGGRINLADIVVAPQYFPSGGYLAEFSRATSFGLDVDLNSYFLDDPRGQYVLSGGYGLDPNPASEYFNGARFEATATVTYSFTPTADVPEPGTLAVVGMGLLGLALRRRAA